VIEQTATVAPVVEPAPAATTPEPPKPEAPAKTEPDWQVAYQGLQRSVNKRDQRIENILTQNQALLGAVETLKGDVDTVLKNTVGEEGLKTRQAERQAISERQEALAAANTAKEYIPASINVMAATMRAAGVPEPEIYQIFKAASEIPTVAEWGEATQTLTTAAIARARASESTKAQAKSQEEVKVEANALAERTLRTKGIDKVDLGRGQSQTPERNLVERIRSIDRNTPEGETQWQNLRKDVMRGTLKT
jgi:hypothetical protein